MVDRAELKALYRQAVKTCLALILVPVLLVGVALFMYDQGGLGSEAVDPLLFWIWGFMALQPLWIVPLYRFVITPRAIALAPESPEPVIASQAITEYALWELSTLMGFVIFFMSGIWIWFLATLALTFAGFAVSFPRWSDWTERADKLDQRAGARSVVPT